jgi:hypothetical protein
MLVVGVSGLVLAVVHPDPFLFAVGIFSLWIGFEGGLPPFSVQAILGIV